MAARFGGSGRGWFWATLALIGATVAGLWFGPRHMDWTPYKPDIQALISRQLGVAVSIDGPLKIELLPQPRITAGAISVLGPGPSGTIRWLRGRLDPAALVQGDLVPRNLELVEADLEFPIHLVADGRYSGDTLVQIVDGSLRFIDGPDWLPDTIAQIDGRLRLGGGLSTLFSFDGEARLNEQPVGISLETKSGGAITIAIAHGPSAMDLALQGGPSKDGGWAGRATLVMEEAAFLSTLRAEAITRLIGEGPATVDARITAKADGELALDVESLESARLSGGGQAVLKPGPHPALDIRLALDRVDLTDDAVAARRLSGDISNAVKRLADMAVTGHITARRVETASEDGLRDAVVSFSAEHGVASLDHASARLPGDTVVLLQGTVEPAEAGWRYDGQASLTARNLRAALVWLGSGGMELLETLPSDRLRQADLTARILASPDAVEIAELAGRLDGIQWIGAVSLPLTEDGGPVRAVLEGDRMNLDRYVPGDGGNAEFLDMLDVLLRGDPGWDLVLHLDRAIFGGVPADDFDISLYSAEGPHAAQMNLSVGDLAGAAATLHYQATDTGTANGRLHITIPAAERFLGAFGLPARRAAWLAPMGETQGTIDLSFAPDRGVGYALEALGSGGDIRLNGLVQPGPRPRVTVSDGAFNVGALSFSALEGDCSGDGDGGWTCRRLAGETQGLAIDAAAELTPPQDDGVRLTVDIGHAEADLGLFVSRAGLPLVPEGAISASGVLSGAGRTVDEASQALAGTLMLEGQAGLALRSGGGGRLGNIDGLRRALRRSFGTADNPLTGTLTLTPESLSMDVRLDGQGAVMSASAAANRIAERLKAALFIREAGRSDSALTLTAEGPIAAPGVTLKGPWISGR